MIGKFSKSEPLGSGKLDSTTQGNCECLKKGRIVSIAGVGSWGNYHIGGDAWFES